ncbi:MAG: FKBP-type peptidyl-prolyl cis-trans isomerase [Oceanobacter sp.]
MSVATISANSQISLHFSLKMDDGQVIDSTFDRAPASFSMGDGSLLPGFEARLLGLVTGDRKEFDIPPEDGFGQPNPNNMQTMKRTDFAADMPIAPGLVVSFADAQNAELPGVIASIEGDRVEVDFNHPLAGKTLKFDVQILEVKDADQAG